MIRLSASMTPFTWPPRVRSMSGIRVVSKTSPAAITSGPEPDQDVAVRVRVRLVDQFDALTVECRSFSD